LQEAVDLAITVLNDAGVTYSRQDLVKYGNDALDAMVLLAPYLFHETGELTCTAGETLQVVSFDDAHALVSVLRVKGGDALRRFDKSTMDAFTPGWHHAPQATATGWCPDDANNPMRFFIYPPAPPDQVLELVYVRIPPEYTETEETGVPETYCGAVADYIIAMAESRDDEHVNTNRAMAHLNKFASRFGTAASQTQDAQSQTQGAQ
jgi:hypothetical protein